MNLNEEVICGFRVTENQKHLNAVFLEMIQEFDRLCKNAGMTYWLVFGGLIGAVRHKGFIPWDDDIDIALPRKDFDRLASMTNEQFGVKEPYFLQNPVTDSKCIDILIRFRRSDTTSIRSYDTRALQQCDGPAPYNMGLNLALFPVDNLPKSKRMISFQRWIDDLFFCVESRAAASEEEKPVRTKIARAIIRILTTRGFFRLRHLCWSAFRKNKSGQVQMFGGSYPEDTVWPAECFAGTVYLPFEDITVAVPVGYDTFLSITYGDYMQFPPEEARNINHGAYEVWDTPYAVSVERFRRGEISLPEKKKAGKAE